MKLTRNWLVSLWMLYPRCLLIQDLSEHMRFMNSLLEMDGSEESDEPDSDSDDSSGSKRLNRSSRRIRSGKQRMSIMDNQLYHIPSRDDQLFHDSGCGWHISDPQAPPKSASMRRIFFQSAARWDDDLKRVLVRADGLAMSANVADVMENSGRGIDPDGSEEEMEVEEEGES
jgi:histone deacetylase 1/2